MPDLYKQNNKFNNPVAEKKSKTIIVTVVVLSRMCVGIGGTDVSMSFPTVLHLMEHRRFNRLYLWDR